MAKSQVLRSSYEVVPQSFNKDTVITDTVGMEGEQEGTRQDITSLNLCHVLVLVCHMDMTLSHSKDYLYELTSPKRIFNDCIT
jgi:hypothetical protein